MSVISLVAREDFISVVTDLTNSQLIEETMRFKVLIPDTAFIALIGDEELVQMAGMAAETLVKQDFSLREIAESIQSSYSTGDLTFTASGRFFEAVIAGYSLKGEAQYHIISNSKELESYYPAPGECLYYANGHEKMLVFERMLKIHGMATISQVQAAQNNFFAEAANTIPDVNTPRTSLLLKKIN